MVHLILKMSYSYFKFSSQHLKVVFLLGFFYHSMISSHDLLAQDIIYTMNGKKYDCKIDREDSLNVHFTAFLADEYRSSFVAHIEIDTIIYQFDKNINETGIVKFTNGETLYCFLEAEDYKNYYYCLFNAENATGSFIPKENVASIQYDLSNERPIGQIGIGYGIDYGGIGVKMQANINSFFKMFLALGVDNYKFSRNFGVSTNFRGENTKSKISPYIQLMYGTNTNVGYGLPLGLRKMFYGPTVGGGIEIISTSGSSLSIGMLLPYRSKEVDKYIEKLRLTRSLEFTKEFKTLEFSIGYAVAIR